MSSKVYGLLVTAVSAIVRLFSPPSSGKLAVSAYVTVTSSPATPPVAITVCSLPAVVRSAVPMVSSDSVVAVTLTLLTVTPLPETVNLLAESAVRTKVNFPAFDAVSAISAPLESTTLISVSLLV